GLVAAATWCTARALDPSPSVAPIVFATLASWVVGMVVLPVPGGLGVREAVFATLASTALPVGVAATVAVVARLVFMLADAAGVALAAPLARRQPSSLAAPEPSAAPDEPVAPVAPGGSSSHTVRSMP
ncbi:hypothetical protein B7486_64330, partial [cyanobacterium TDX16]